jgi:biopolymer transport protein ExbD
MIDVVFQLLLFFMLSMRLQEVEGKLFSQLPRRGTLDAPSSPLEELRVVLCAGGRAGEHFHDRGRHARAPKNGPASRVFVERLEIGELHPTETRLDRAAHNRSVWTRLVRRLRELSPFRTADGRSRPVVVDADAEVPYEHVLGAVDACVAAGFDRVEFAADPLRPPRR